MIIDAHCHAWRRWPYESAVPDPARGSVANLLWEMDRAGVTRAVVICAAIGGNDDNAGDVATAGHRDRLALFADLDCRWHATHQTPGGVDRLRALVDRLRPAGITFYLREDQPAEWLLSADGDAFLGAIAARGFVLSLACGPRQAETVVAAALRHPRMPILIHHLWRVRAGDEAALRAATDAARAPNLFVKLSGFGYGVDAGWDFPLQPVQRVARALAAAYGPQRLVWGSDWPVSARFMTHRQTLEIVRTHGPFDTPGERDAVLGGNMARLLDGWRPG